MPRGKVADVQTDPGEPGDLGHLPLRQEPVGDPALIELLDRARVQTARSRTDEVLAGAPFDDGHVDSRQGQLARQHQPRRTRSDDQHRVFGHRHDRIVTAVAPRRDEWLAPSDPDVVPFCP